MDTVASLLPLIKILAAFAAMLLGIRLRIGLGASILAGAALTGLFFGLPLGQWPGATFDALSNEKTLFLSAIVGLIMLLSGTLAQTGQSKRLMDSLTGYLRSPKLRLVFFPALIGLLPMPGGAVFSAPMVDEVSRDMGLDNTDKVMLNYWFRHVWELAWPLYPGIILSASLADIPLHRLIAYTFPAIPVMFLLGWFFVLRRVKIPAQNCSSTSSERNLGHTLSMGLPLLIAICGAVGLEMGIGLFMPGIAFEWGVLIALGAAILCAVVQNRMSTSDLGKILFSKHLGQMLFVIVAIFIFKEFMQASGVVSQLSRMAGGSVALIASAVLLPFIVGLISGINVAFVGATFPLMLGLLAQLDMMDQVMPYLVLGQFAGYTGVMVSPIHICFLLTCQHFKVDLGLAWRRLAVPCLLLMAFGLGYFMLLRG
ncbi:MAG: DUF401 family protein [Proteobacteria bacterium]|nr:DUF401 family protein [Pseudomonadota bacterium]